MASVTLCLGQSRVPASAATSPPEPTSIPATRAPALDGHTVSLPQDLASAATVLILGFGRKSAGPTTAWEQPVRTHLATEPSVGFYDMPLLAEVPGWLRPLILSAIAKKIPEVLRSRFVPLTADEAAWKQLAGYTATAPDAAYVVLVDRAGQVRWSTHEPYSPERFAVLAAAAHTLAR